MKNAHRKFIKQAGLASLSAAALASIAACADTNSNAETIAPEPKPDQGLSKRLVSLEEMFDESTLNLEETFAM